MRLSQLQEREIAVHKSTSQFDEIDLSMSADGTLWLAHPDADWDHIVTTGNNVDHYFEIDPRSKLASWDDIDRYTTDQLEAQGYDGVRMDDGGNNITYQIWNTNILKRISHNNEGMPLNEVAVKSSWIADLDYVEGETYMRLKNGRAYVIRRTEPRLYDRWFTAPSKGKFWHSDVKGLYQVRRIG